MFKAFQEQQQYTGAGYVFERAHMPACMLGCMHACVYTANSQLPAVVANTVDNLQSLSGCGYGGVSRLTEVRPHTV